MNTVITIGRQFGSGGREIGEKLAEHFGIKCYDKELLSRAAKDSGFCEEMIKTHDERPTNSFLYNLVMDTYSFGYNTSTFMDMPISHKVFLAQFDAIKKLAGEGPCVMVGRCADYILKDDPDAYHIFICGNESEKIARTQKLFDLSEKEARNMNQDMDKKRRLHYEYYTDRKWGDFKNHCMILNTSVLGLERCIQYIVELIEVAE